MSCDSVSVVTVCVMCVSCDSVSVSDDGGGGEGVMVEVKHFLELWHPLQLLPIYSQVMKH